MFQKLIEFFFGKKESKPSFSYLEQSVPKALIDNFVSQAQQKIATEGWGKQGRNVEVKTRNSLNLSIKLKYINCILCINCIKWR